MRIKDLKHTYPEAYLRALKNMKKEIGFTNENSKIILAFNWNNSKEGGYYWDSVWLENFDKAKKILKDKEK